jgi:hypothetical protein
MQELHPCGAETIYMDPDYLQEVVKGMLRVHVRKAAGLSPQGEKQECNPFVTVAVGPSAGVHVLSGLLDLCVSLTLMPWSSACVLHDQRSAPVHLFRAGCLLKHVHTAWVISSWS